MNQSCSSPKFVARASAALLKTRSTINRITAALVLSACVVAAAAQSDSAAFAKFKSEMMPKVGQKITVVGTLYDGKQGFWLAFNNWGAYIYAVKESGVEKENDLYAHFRRGQPVKVTGTLRHFAEPAATREDEQHAQYVQRAPEHFFFDAAEVKMVPLVPPPLKNPKKERQ
jgi:hypothetical protein